MGEREIVNRIGTHCCGTLPHRNESCRDLCEDPDPGIRVYGGIPLIHWEQRKAMAIRDVEIACISSMT